MKRIVLCMCLLLSASVLMAQKYELVWKDSFRGKTLDDSKWTRITRGKADWRNYMSLNDSLFDLRRGKLVLRCIANDGTDPSDTAAFLTGGVYTKGRFNVGYGKVEVKVRLQGGKSVWPAIWMLPQNGKWPDGGEIDIMERLNHDDFVYQTVHSRYTQIMKRKQDPLSSVCAPIDPDRYNVFAVEILPDSIVFSVNGVKTLIYPRISSDEFPTEVQFPFGTPYYILIDMQIGGAWVGAADGTDLPVEMYVDWIKVYSLKS